MAATGLWSVGEDGCLSIGTPIQNIVYHPNLNVILVTSKEPSVQVIDVTSGSVLHKSDLSAVNGDRVQLHYIVQRDKIVFCDGNSVGTRKDLNGILLLDTSLQSPVDKTEDVVRVELPLPEAVHLFKALMSLDLPGVVYVEDVLRNLEQEIETVQQKTKGNHKVAKWATVCLKQPHCALKTVSSSMVGELRNLNHNGPALQVASSLNDRMSYLLPSGNPEPIPGGPVDRSLMYGEAARRETFSKWPHMNYKWALPDPMAAAGFYHQPSSSGDDRAMCFTCNVCLVCWEPTDEPWSEHERHSPACPFVKGEYTHNVPMSVTYATDPAQRHGALSEKIECISTSSSEDYVATSTFLGSVVVWNINRQLKKQHEFCVDPWDPVITAKTGQRPVPVTQSRRQTDGTLVACPPQPTSSAAEAGGEEPESSLQVIEVGGAWRHGKVGEIVEIPLNDLEPSVNEGNHWRRPSEDVMVTSLCLVGPPKETATVPQAAGAMAASNSSSTGNSSNNSSVARCRPCLVSGVAIRKSPLSISETQRFSNPDSDSRNEVQALNQVNQALSEEPLMQIISDGCVNGAEPGENSHFVPYLLVHDVETDGKGRKVKDNEKIEMETQTKTITVMSSMQDLFPTDAIEFEDDPDPDVQIVGITPPLQGGTIMETSSLAQSNSENGEVTASVPPEPKKPNNSQVHQGNSPGVKEGKVVQCIELPPPVTGDHYVQSLTPTLDGSYILVNVAPKCLNEKCAVLSGIPYVSDSEQGCSNPEKASQNGATSSGNSNSNQNHACGGCLLLYKVNTNSNMVLLEEEAIRSCYFSTLGESVTSVIILPRDLASGEDDEYSQVWYGGRAQENCDEAVTGQIAVTTHSGDIRVLSLKDFSVLACIERQGDVKFSSLAYCCGIDRLCASTSTGDLRFYHIKPKDLLEDKDITAENGSPAKGDTAAQREDDPMNTHDNDLLVKQPLTTEVLAAIQQLTLFENLMPRFTATVPQCWQEIQQEQQQRRHPQHLQQQGEAMQHTRTWRLQQDSTSWDEHLFELVLPKPCSVGHVDLKFTLHPMCTRPPNVQVTLLKQNIANINRSVATEVDSRVDFHLPGKSSKLDQVPEMSTLGETGESNKFTLDPEFLGKHSAEILCGPLDIANFVDLSGHSGVVTFTSPLLLKVKSRSLLVHIKALSTGQGKNESKTNKQEGTSSTSTSTPLTAAPPKNIEDALSEMYGYKPLDNDVTAFKAQATSKSRSKQKMEDVKGCDWLHELSVTIRRSRKTPILKDRLQRVALLEQSIFHDQLLMISCGQDSQTQAGVCLHHRQSLALDILCWVISVQLNDPNKSMDGHCIVNTVQSNLKGLIKACFIEGGRTVAHKCAKLIALCLEYSKTVDEADVVLAFSFALVQALLDSLPLVPTADSAGAVHWYFTLLNRVKCLDVNRTAQGCVELLTLISRQYYERKNPLHSLLRARYGLYGTPLDPELFDMEPPHLSKLGSSQSASYASILNTTSSNNNNPGGGASAGASQGYDEPDFRDLLNLSGYEKGSTKTSVDSLSNCVHGLLEVEPLHFTSHSTSDGLRVENLDAGNTGTAVGTVTPTMSGTINFHNGITGGTNPTEQGTVGLSSAMASAEQQLHILQLKQLKLLKLQQQKMKLEQKLAETSKNVAAAAATINSLPSVSYSYSSELCPPTPKTTPLFMTPPMTPPSEVMFLDADGKPVLSKNNKGNKGEPARSSIPLVASQTLLQPPPPQVLVVERMHSGARRFVVLDFGKPVLLTDVIIPACADLASLSVDTWVHSEEVDGQRLLVAADIAMRSLVLSDLQPPPICRYLKITTVGRYSGGTTRSKIPIGSFYGHSFILPWEMDSVGLGPLGSRPGENGSGFSQVDQSHMLSQLSLLMTLQEDIQCRYSLAQHRLQTVLNSVEVPACSSMHTQYFLRQDNKEEDKKVNHAYHDCIQLQIQLNLAQRAIKRLQQALGIGLLDVESVACANTMMAVKQASSDKLRCLMEHIVDTLLSMTYVTPSNPQPPLSLYRSFTPQLVETLFKSCCISGTRQMQVHAGMLMLRTCGHLNWWGDFVAQILQEFFSSEQPEIFPQHRVFLLLTVFGQKALTGSSSSCILQSVLAVLAKLLVPLTHQQHGYPRSGTGLDLSLISWFLLFISKSLDSFHAHEEAPKGAGKDGGGGASGGGGGSRWDFMHGENTLQTSKTVTKSTNSRLYRLYHRKLQKRLMHTKQQLLDLQQAKKNFISSQMEKGAAAVSKETETLLKQQEILFKKQLKQYTSKHFKDIMQMRRTDAEVLKKMPRESGHSLETEGMDTDYEGLPVLPREKCIPVVKGLTALLLSMDFTCNVDLFIVACKVLARVANVARPTICLPEIMSQQELEQLVLLTCSIEVNYGNISWGGAWAGHAITCLLLDILEARSLCHSPSSTLDKEVSGEEDMTVSMTETDDTLAKSVSLPPMFDELPPSDSTVDTSSVLVMEDLESSLEDNYEENKSGKAVGIPPPVGSGSFGHIWSHTSGNSLFSGGKSAFEVIDKKLKTSNNWKTKLSSYSSSSKSVAGPSGVSAAMDARLELGLDTLPELRLKMMQSLETEVIQQALVAAMPPEVEVSTVSQHVASGEEETTDQQPQSFSQPLQQHVSTTEMLTTCFNHMFVQLQLQRVNLDNLLTLWLTLNEEGPSEESSNTSHSFNPSCVPSIPLSHVSVTSLLQALVWAVHVPARTWVLAFQTLTLLMNLKVSDGQGEGQKKWLATIVIADNNLMGMLIKFLSGVSSAGPVLGSSQTSQAGPPSVTAFYDFLGRLQMRCMEESSDHLKTLLLKLVYTLSAERGAFHDGLGPLDAQCRFLDFMLEQVYERVDINNAISVIQSVVQLVHHHIESQDRVSCRSPGEGSISARSCFGGLFASILRGGDSKSMTGDSNRDILMCHLLRLVNVLIQVPLPNTNQPGASAGNVPEPAVTATQPSDVLLSQNSMTDASKLSQGLASSSQNMPDEEKCSETDEQKQEHLEAAAAAASADASSSQPLQPAVKLPMLANLILSHQPIMGCLLQTLSRCNSNTMAMIIGSSGLQNSMQDSFNVIDPLSVGDTVFQILSTLNSKATSVDKMLKPLFEYISMGLQGPSTAGISRVSEPLLWFVLRVLNDEEALKSFLEMGGVQVVCRNLVHSNRRVINTNPSMISTMMQFLSFERATAPPAKKTSTDTDNPEGLHNFAPLGTVTSSSPTAGPADVLIQASPPHRRARSAAWSYHFYPEEAWVDLTITLPCAILLKEVHIQPHLTSLATCPAAASLEISHDGTLSFPVCQPMSTSGLTLIKLQLHKPEVASTVTVRLHKPRDSTTIGLSQILVMGHAAFNDRFTLSASRIFMPTEDYVSRTSIGWLRLLHHCLTHVQNMQKEVAAAAATVPNLLVTCTALLVAPAYVVYASNIENVLLKIGLHSVDMGLNLIENMLRNPCIVTDNTELPFHGKVNGLANESTIDILYQLGITQDDGTSERMKALLEWLGDSARVSLQRLGHQGDDGYRTLPRTGSPDLPHPAPAHVHCIAAILWHSQELPVTYDLQALVTKELFSSVFEWAMVLPINSVLKKAVDYILCAICYVCPEYFPLLLEWMGVILTMDLTNASVSDDHKDVGQQRHLLERQQMMTDDSKEAGVQNNVLTGAGRSQPIAPPEINHVIPDEPHLSTLATVCQSPVALKQLLDSNFPAVLCQGLFEFCTRELAQHSDTLACLEMYTDASKSNISTPRSPRSRSRNDSVDSAQSQSAERGLLMTADLVAPVLQFLAEVCKECEMKQWLGGPEGNIFWHVLLTLLCNTTPRATLWPSLMPVKHRTLTREQRANIEDAAIEFFTNVIACHQENQQLFASVLCDVVRGHGSIEHGASTPLSGFTRRLFLQVLLEDEKVLVSFRSSSQLYKIHNNGLGRNLHHPKFGSGHKYRTLTVGLQSTCGEVLGKVSDTPSLTSQILENRDDKKVEERKDTGELGLEVVDQLSASAGLQAKEKRNKNNTPPPPRPPSRMGRRSSVSATMHIPVLTLYHQLLPGQPLPAELTLSQLFVLLHERGFPVGQASLDFTMRLRAKTLPSGKVEKKVKSDHDTLRETEWIDFEAAEAGMEPIAEEMLLETPPSASALQVFASIGGLALLAEHLPLLYPEIARQSSGTLSQPTKDSTSSPSDGLGQEWSVIMEAGEDLMYEEVPEPVMYGNQQSQARSSGTVLPTVPPHSLVAFGLFLRLPGYAEVLLKERKRAQCLLRLVLGVTDDGDGGFILTSPVAGALPTLPFSVLKTLYDSTPLTTDDGVLLRRMSLEVGVLHLVLACLSVLSHHAPRSQIPGHHQEIILAASQAASALASGSSSSSSSQKANEEKTQNYWAKGTGFGTGSTTSSWDAEQALLRQKAEEEHVTCLLQVIASFINPGGLISRDSLSSDVTEKNNLPPLLSELLSQSCLVPAMASYLRNDSVLDMARHVPLYRSLLELLRGIAFCPLLVPLLLPLDKDEDASSAICSLLDKMKGCVDTYSSRLKTNKNNSKSTQKRVSSSKSKQEEEESEGLALLIPDIQQTATLVQESVSRLRSRAENRQKEDGQMDAQGAAKNDHSYEEQYMALMKELQFDTFEFVTDDETGLRFTMPHHYESYIKSAGEVNNASRARRLAQEAVTLSTSLPLSASSSVFVRCDEERLDVMKVLITGPAETPYANGCFEFDVYFPQDYPNSPPLVNLETTGNHTVRFNPNLYNDGKVCLSVLNTWHGRPEEKWNAQTSSFLQVLVSIQSLILVSEPYFNEPGYERSRGTPSGTASSREYDANIRQASVKWAMLEMLKNPPLCFKEVIHKHFWLKRHEIIGQINSWIADLHNHSNDKRTGRTVAHSCMALKRHFHQLKEELNKMKAPEELGGEETSDSSNSSEDSQCLNELGKTLACDGELAAGTDTSESQQTPPPPPVDEDGALSECNTFSGQHFNGDQALPAIEMVPPEHNNNVDISEFVDLL